MSTIVKHKHISNGLFPKIFFFLVSPFHISFSLFSIRPLLLHWLLSSARKKCSFRCSRFGQRPTNNVQHISMRGTIYIHYVSIRRHCNNETKQFFFFDSTTTDAAAATQRGNAWTWTWDAGKILFHFFSVTPAENVKEEFFTKHSRSMQMQWGRAPRPVPPSDKPLTCTLVIRWFVCQFRVNVDWIFFSCRTIAPRYSVSHCDCCCSVSASPKDASNLVRIFSDAPLQIFIVIAWRSRRSILCGVQMAATIKKKVIAP